MTLGQNMKVKVNHKRVSLPFVSLGVLSVVQEGYSVVVRTNLGEFVSFFFAHLFAPLIHLGIYCLIVLSICPFVQE